MFFLWKYIPLEVRLTKWDGQLREYNISCFYWGNVLDLCSSYVKARLNHLNQFCLSCRYVNVLRQESCRILLARLEYLRDTFQIKEGDFLTFDALV